ncbi:hypothetical protein V1515DRAFT_464730, partial [Lipomyces mesembrius]
MASPPTSSSKSAEMINECRESDPGTPGRERAIAEYFESQGPEYEPIMTRTFTHEGQRPELVRLASAFSSAEYRTATGDGEVGLEQKDTLAGVEFGDPVLDPSKPEFDFYKWVRMFLRLMEEDGIK